MISTNTTSLTLTGMILVCEGFVKIADTKDIQPSQMKEVRFDDEDVCIANVDRKYYAIGNVYTHEGGPLDDGILEGYEVECPWHGSKFDIRNGKVARPPAQRQEPTYEVKVEDGGILIRKQQKDKPDQR